MLRRNFISTLFATPVATTILGVPLKASPTESCVHLPIGCDLSFNALQWAFDVAKTHNFGKPKFLLIGPENKFVARELLGSYKKLYTADSELNALLLGFPFEVTRALPSRTWKMVFEHGIVVSEGPR